MLKSIPILLGNLICRYPWALLCVTFAAIALLALNIGRLDIDASPDSLLLENDIDLKYYRELHREYGSDEYIVVALSLADPLFELSTLKAVDALSRTIASLEHVDQVTNPTNVPLLQQKSENKKGKLRFPNLLSPNADIGLAKKELSSNPLYVENLISPDAKTIALIVNLKPNQALSTLIEQRYTLSDPSKADTSQSGNEQLELQEINTRIDEERKKTNRIYTQTIESIRAIVDKYHSLGDFYLAGAPLVASDIQHFVISDIKIFGAAMLIILALVLYYFFKGLTWVAIALFCAVLNVLAVSGIIALLGFKLTVISSNYVALLMIFSIALAVHIIVRYEESRSQSSSDVGDGLRETIRYIFAPCAYMVISSTVAFISLLVSDVKPVIDFGLIMIIGLFCAFVICFSVLPALIFIAQPNFKENTYVRINHFLKTLLYPILHYRLVVSGILVILIVAGIAGILRLTVENRFIDYFKSDTEIYRGLEFVDQELGGTVPLEIVLESYKPLSSSEQNTKAQEDDYFSYVESQSSSLVDLNQWYSRTGIDRVRTIHNYLESIPQIGKVLSIATTEDVLVRLNDDDRLEDFELSLIYQRIPEEIKDILFYPYLSRQSDQTRILARIKDSDHSLVRDELLHSIKTHINSQLLDAHQDLRISGISVLYNNLLQSLFRSQILTLGTVFLCILVMLAILFRSLSLAFIGTLPNVLTASLILGLMGLLDIPLNIMTITIAAITVGIGVDDAIHYIHRFQHELRKSGEYQTAIHTVQTTVGKALFFTSVTITLGFAIMMASNFVPSVYFGLFTSAAMIGSLLTTFTLIPLLLVTMRPIRIADKE